MHNCYVKTLYKNIIRPLLFYVDPESVHGTILKIGSSICNSSHLRSLIASLMSCEDERLKTRVLGLEFPNPVGLAAGFDKDAIAFNLFDALGFGSIEIGTVTPRPQAGNPRPRIFRYPSDSALINRMGFPSDGVSCVAERLALILPQKRNALIGVNIGKNKETTLEMAVEDYVLCFKGLYQYGDYFVLNVSSPNTPELRKLQEPARLRELFSKVREYNSGNKPLLIKIAPDLSFPEIDGILDIALGEKVSGIIATNTTISREGLSSKTAELGGMSGVPLHNKSVSIVSYLYKRTGAKVPIIGCGGIFNSEDALHFLMAGASLVQIYTGLIYEGPTMVCDINRGLIAYMDKVGIKSLDEVRGVGESCKINPGA